MVFFNEGPAKTAVVDYKITYITTGKTVWCTMVGLILIMPGAYLVGKRLFWEKATESEMTKERLKPAIESSKKVKKHPKGRKS